MFFVRLLIGLAIFCAPIVLYVVASRKADNALYLMFPMFGAIPGAIGAALVFVPLEHWLDARGLAHLANWAVPASGATLIVLFVIVTLTATRRFGVFRSRVARNPAQALAPLLVWSVLGTLWGAAWRASAWAVAAIARAIHG